MNLNNKSGAFKKFFFIILSFCLFSIVLFYSIHEYKNIGFQNTVENVVSFIKFGHEYAVTHWKNVFMEIYEKKNLLSLYVDNYGEKVLKKNYILPEKYSIKSDVSKITMESSGNFYFPEAGSPPDNNKLKAWIKIKNLGGKEKKIELWGFGGSVIY